MKRLLLIPILAMGLLLTGCPEPNEMEDPFPDNGMEPEMSIITSSI